VEGVLKQSRGPQNRFPGLLVIGENGMLFKRYPLILLVIVLAFWTWSGINLVDTRLTWVLETAPFMIALPILLLTYRRFPLTDLTYTLIAIHATILMLGGHYSYAKVPLGFWMEDWFGWTRNNYDKIGHFMQGFGPAIYAREILARTSLLKRGKWLGFLAVAVPLAFSAIYEIIEWLASLSNPTDTEAFLGTQGYLWDTQTDMLWCLIGSIVAVIALTKLHDRSLQKIGVN
jgi:putative membrane protein